MHASKDGPHANEPGRGGLGARSPRPILVALLLAAFSVDLDTTIVNIALLVFTVIGARAHGWDRRTGRPASPAPRVSR